MSNRMLIPFSTTLHVRDTCLCLHVQRAARALARRFDTALKPLGLNNGQFSLMMALNRPEPVPMGPVATLLAMDRTTLTAAIKVLERRSMVETMPDPKDRRSRLMRLTEDGRQLLSQALPVWQQVHGALDEELGENMEPLRQTLLAIR
ncbi:MAG TPA: MarR family transcriptional regulator [Pseudorhizobium sp.]|nr:MarR family transcriptional regulator [Pseudorhizobium sp.]